MTDAMTPEEARERVIRHIRSYRERTWNANPYESFRQHEVDLANAILATTDALAALLDPAVVLSAWERAGRVEANLSLPTVGRRWYRLTEEPT